MAETATARVTVTLAMASGPGQPEGSPDHRYALHLALDPRGHPDAQAWQEDPEPWPAHRIRPDEPELEGDVQYDPDDGWSLRFFWRAAEGPDVPSHRLEFGPEPVRPGTYVTVIEPEGARYDYRVVGVG